MALNGYDPADRASSMSRQFFPRRARCRRARASLDLPPIVPEDAAFAKGAWREWSWPTDYFAPLSGVPLWLFSGAYSLTWLRPARLGRRAIGIDRMRREDTET